MEMEFNDDRGRGRFVIVIGLILAVVAGGAAFFLISQAQQQAAQPGAQGHDRRRGPRRSRPASRSRQPTWPSARSRSTRRTPRACSPTRPRSSGSSPASRSSTGQPVYANLLASQAQGGQFSILGPGETIGAGQRDLAGGLDHRPRRPRRRRPRPAGRHRRRLRHRDGLASPRTSPPAGRYYTDKSTKITYQDLRRPGQGEHVLRDEGPELRSPRRSATSRRAGRPRSAWPCGRRTTLGPSTRRGSARRRT